MAVAHHPTAEQQAAIDLFGTGANLVIEAGAGTGKTTTLGMLARTTPRGGHYLAFNRAIARDAGRAMPNTVRATTVHSAAAQALRRDPRQRALMDRLGGARISSQKVAKHLRLGHVVVEVPTAGAPRTKVLQPAWQAGHINRAIRAYCQSDSPTPGPEHFPYVHGIDAPGRSTNNVALAKELMPGMVRAWDDLGAPHGMLRYEHDHYLKQWALGHPKLGAEFVMLDEAQDASPVMLDVLARQGCQVVYVGDTHQQIYEWRGAINALGLVDGPRTYLTQSWRFGSGLAAIANILLAQLDATLRLVGAPGVATKLYHGSRPRPRAEAVLCRSNAHAVNVVMQYQARGMAPHLVGGAEDILHFAQAAARLQAGERVAHPELACFATWHEVQDYVANDPQGSELGMLVNLLDEYGVEIVCDALDGTVAEEGADVVISTAHKAKGREWGSVRLGADYPNPEGDEPLPPEELRLLYVAATRARLGLDLSACAPLLKLVGIHA